MAGTAHTTGPSTRLAVALALAALLLLLSFSCKKPKPLPPPPPEVVVAPVIQREVPIRREWVATLTGLVNAVIKPQVTGYLVRQDYLEGRPVKKGQVMFEIDPRPFQAALDRANANVVQYQSQQENARENLARVEPLTAQRALSQKDLDNARAALRAAKAQVIAARAAVETAKLNLEFTKIRAPIDGIAGIAQAQIGNLVGPSQTGQLTTVSTIDPILADFSVGEQDYLSFVRLNALREGKASTPAGFRIDLILADGSVYPHRGKFYATNRQISPKTGTLLVEAVFPNPDMILRPGQFGKVQVTLGTQKALLIPQPAVSELQGKFQANVVGPDNRVEIRDIKPGSWYGSLWEIEEGLRPGERVVVEGMQKVKPGMTVRPVAAPPGPPTGPQPGTGPPRRQESTGKP
ncbi:MAG: efflux RND transporter periplasmic adaptor subunit [Desulfobacteraceae bacterium]|nr:efflux RND transporter periplasmic adaptor subunit [Desulfobacteraceae bacterium]